MSTLSPKALTLEDLSTMATDEPGINGVDDVARFHVDYIVEAESDADARKLSIAICWNFSFSPR